MAVKVKVICVVILLIAAAATMMGCETAKGFATGIGMTAMGAAEDVKNFCDGASKADGWIRDNLW